MAMEMVTASLVAVKLSMSFVMKGLLRQGRTAQFILDKPQMLAEKFSSITTHLK